MKHLFLISALLVLFNSSFGCSCDRTKSFCTCALEYDFAGSCVVLAKFPHSVSLKVLHDFNGNESRDTITVWDKGGPYNMCNDSLSGASASGLGNIGDTIIVAMSKIQTVVTPWDVIGDYVKSGFNCEANLLRVVNNTVIGRITGSEYCHFMNNCLDNYNYDSFMVDFPIHRYGCQTWLGTNDVTAPERLSFYPTPFESSLSFSGDIINRIVSITATDIIGQTVPVVVSGNTVSFSAPSASGLYIINTTLSDGNVLSHKVVKQ